MIRTIGVVVPVADEQDLLPACLRALHASRAELHRQAPEVAVRIVVVLDDCTDGSERIARGFPGVEVVGIAARRVGTARRAGCAHLIAGERHPEDLWLANTDGDSRVPVEWLSGMHACAVDGADVVLGTARPEHDLPARVRAAWLRAHVLDEDHHHVHGANFGLRADTYLRLGGWPELVSGEDQAFADSAAGTEGVRIVRTARFPVATSTRLAARAPFGFSSYLRGLVTQVGADG